MRSILRAVVVAGTLLLALSVRAEDDDQITVSSCSGQPSLPVSFKIDCSHLENPATRQLCRPFIENQACKVFPAYRRITGIKLEDTCKSVKFTIYQDNNWPHPRGEGGLALHCSVDYLEQYSVKFRKDSKIGPYDVHELLHEYQIALGPLPSMHPLFSSSMAEATKAVGDDEQYQRELKNMQNESKRLHDELESGKYASAANQCSIAQTAVEESLYLENSRLLPMFYLKLPPTKGNSQTERDARFDRMFFVVSSANPGVKKLLVEHGCGPF